MKTVFGLILFLVSNVVAGERMKVFLFPGQGSDHRIFSDLTFDTSFELVHVHYPMPEKGMTLKAYAVLIGKQLDTSGRYAFIGVSLGGMICTELADLMKPEKVIIISSAKCKAELPFRYRFQHRVPLNRVIPPALIKAGALLLQPLVEPDRNERKQVFKSMLKNKDAVYLKRTIDMIVNWDRTTFSAQIIHIHGTSDHTLPIRNVAPNYVVSQGSHMMTLTQAVKINAILSQCL